MLFILYYRCSKHILYFLFFLVENQHITYKKLQKYTFQSRFMDIQTCKYLCVSSGQIHFRQNVWRKWMKHGRKGLVKFSRTGMQCKMQNESGEKKKHHRVNYVFHFPSYLNFVHKMVSSFYILYSIFWASYDTDSSCQDPNTILTCSLTFFYKS